jgi:hypothetical protein
MKTTTKQISALAIILACLISINACKKEYTGKIVFWYNQSTANHLVTDGSTALTYTVDGKIVGSSAANVYYTSAPDCGSNGSITVEKDLGSSKSKSFSYSIKDQTGDIIWSGSVTFEANTCTKTQLTY